MNTKQSTEQNANDDLELLIGINISCPANGGSKIPCEIGPSTQDERCEESYVMREEAAKFQKLLPLNNQQCSGDENLYPNKIASFSKALKHNNLGEADIDDYNIYLKAVQTGTHDKFEEIPLGGLTKFVDPLAAYSYDMMGPDSHHLTMRAAPSFASAETAGEMAEDYWLALTRDIPFCSYDTSRLIEDAAEDLSKLSDFRGPKTNGKVTPGTIFRGNTPGELTGPFISQFLYKNIPFGANEIQQQYTVPVAKRNFMTSYNEWLRIQNGESPEDKIIYDPKKRYIRNGRDMAEYVHRDFSFQGTISACLILLGLGKNALSDSNPYIASGTMEGFVTFGPPHILDFVAKVSCLALKAAWFQKFLVNRRLRPEEFGGRVENLLAGRADYPISDELLNSKALDKTYSKYRSYLLPMAFPEGCPSHTSYPSGHATFTGAGVTIMKAFFNESYEIPNPVEASSNGLKLVDYEGLPLTIGRELNKLASNIALGRDTAGVHYRSDGAEGMKLGEAVAIGLLQDYRNAFSENFSGFSFTKFDGTRVTI